MAELLAATARGSSRAGTNEGVSACRLGICNARAAPSSTEVDRISVLPIQPPALAPISTAATTACSARLMASSQRRSCRSARWPAGRVSSRAGTNCIRPTRPSSQALPVSSYICQPSATISIWLAAVPAMRAPIRRR